MVGKLENVLSFQLVSNCPGVLKSTSTRGVQMYVYMYVYM